MHFRPFAEKALMEKCNKFYKGWPTWRIFLTWTLSEIRINRTLLNVKFKIDITFLRLTAEFLKIKSKCFGELANTYGKFQNVWAWSTISTIFLNLSFSGNVPQIY